MMRASQIVLLLAYTLVASAAAAAPGSRFAVLTQPPHAPGVMQQPSLVGALLRLRGGVRQLQDRDDWAAVQAEAGEKLLVVDFTASWCGPCQRIAPAYAAIADEYAGKALFVKIDVDVLGELAAELGVTSMPTFLFFRSGLVIDTMRGANEAGLRALVAEHAAALPVAA